MSDYDNVYDSKKLSELLKLPDSDGFYVYILLCSDRSLYTGWTSNLKKRIKKHNGGSGAKYTRHRIPVKPVYFEEFEDKISAMKREAQIKKMSRKRKERLILESGGGNL